MGYLHSDRMHNDSVPCEGRGEIWVRGSGVIKGYYKDEEETAAAGLNDPQGWLRSGDIGESSAKQYEALLPKQYIISVNAHYLRLKQNSDLNNTQYRFVSDIRRFILYQ